jgi:tRNA pseudouridine38-40 synthase
MSKRNIKLLIAYDGSNYHGWQRQKSEVTIQGSLEEKISIMVAEKVTLNGAGRTDAGVHALGMVANFHTTSNIKTTGIQRGLNSLLPGDIRIISVSEEKEDFHARFSALGKKYYYNLAFGNYFSPIDRLYCHYCPGELDIETITSCLRRLTGEHDFASFEATGSRKFEIDKGRGAIRKIFKAELFSLNDTKLRIIIEGNGFLRHMVRNIVGTLIEAGKGKISCSRFENILKARNRSAAGPTAPACGLFLEEVYYTTRA